MGSVGTPAPQEGKVETEDLATCKEETEATEGMLLHQGAQRLAAMVVTGGTERQEGTEGVVVTL